MLPSGCIPMASKNPLQLYVLKGANAFECLPGLQLSLFSHTFYMQILLLKTLVHPQISSIRDSSCDVSKSARISAIVFGDQTLFASSESLVRSIEVMSIILLTFTDILELR